MENSTANPATSYTIDCSTCPMQQSSACEDCLVTYLCERDPHDAVIVDFAEMRALRMLADGGLVPRLRHPAVGVR